MINCIYILWNKRGIMKLDKSKQVIITIVVLCLILTVRLRSVEVNVQAFNDNTQTTENETNLPETIIPEATVSEVTPENRSVYSAGLDCTFTLDAFNQLDVETLITFKGIGIVTAEAIINDRKLNGPLEHFDDLKRIKGIGDKKLENILCDLP